MTLFVLLPSLLVMTQNSQSKIPETDLEIFSGKYCISAALSEKKVQNWGCTLSKVHFCTQRLHIGTLVVHIRT